MKLLLLLLYSLLCVHTTFGQQSKLHFIAFADTDDGALGPTNLKTLNELSNDRGLVHDIAQYAGLKVALLLFTGKQCNPTKMDSLLTALTVDKDDVLFFYFIGHGWNNRQNNYPSLIFGNANTDRATLERISRNQYDIYRRLAAKQARLTIVIGEACNKERSDSPPIISKRAIEIMPPVVYSPQKIQSLFRDWTGSAVLSSCQRNQFSHSDPKGGWMSVAWQNTFKDLCGDSNKSKVNWNQLLTKVKQETQATAQRNEREQQPQFELNIAPYSGTKLPPPPPPTSTPTITNSNSPCPSVESYINETALAGIREDLPLLHEMYDEIDSDNAEEYAEAYGLFFKNQQNFYRELGKMVFYESTQLPAQCRPTFDAQTKWVFSNTNDIFRRLSVINKYTTDPRALVQQARSDLPSILNRLENILEKFDK